MRTTVCGLHFKNKIQITTNDMRFKNHCRREDQASVEPYEIDTIVYAKKKWGAHVQISPAQESPVCRRVPMHRSLLRVAPPFYSSTIVGLMHADPVRRNSAHTIRAQSVPHMSPHPSVLRKCFHFILISRRISIN